MQGFRGALPRRRSSQQLGATRTPSTGPHVVLGIVVLLLAGPLLALVVHSLQTDENPIAGVWGLGNWQALVSDARIRDAFVNTLTLALARPLLALAGGALFAWLIVRTDLPGRQWLELGCWVALFAPVLPVLTGWMVLLDDSRGLANVLLVHLPFVDGPIFDLSSWWGIVFVSLLTGMLPMMVFLLAPVFRNWDAGLTEASFSAGAGRLATLFRVVSPLLAPVVIVALVLGAIRSFQSFEIEIILGSGNGTDVLTTLLYRGAEGTSAAYGTANVLGVALVLMIAPLLAVQYWGSRKGLPPSAGPRRLRELGMWKWPAFLLVAAVVGSMTVVPALLLVLGSLMDNVGMSGLGFPFSLQHWDSVGRSPALASAFSNTISLGATAAGIGMVLYAVIAYISIRDRRAGRTALDFITSVPAVLPGVVIGLGLLGAFGMFAQEPSQDSTAALVIAVLLVNLPVGVHIIRARLVQVGPELEEASRVAGAPPLHTLRHIMLPLAGSAIAAAGLQVFASAVSVVGVLALLGTADNLPLSLLHLSYLEDGNYGAGAVAGITVLVMTVAAALMARAIGLRTSARL
ncbi:MAG: iron ABC transporter permease [Dehalococcoidia bacterium]